MNDRRGGNQPGEIGGHRPHRRGNGHVVVVEDHNEPRMHGPGIVHRLIGHACRHRAIADHRNNMVVAAGEIPRHRHAEPGRDRGRGMRGTERVVIALAALGKAGEPAALTQGADTVTPPGEDLVRIGLVANIPDQPVMRVSNT